MTAERDADIQSFVNAFRSRRGSTDWTELVRRGMALIKNNPDVVTRLALTFVREAVDSQTFLDAALSFLPMDAWPDLMTVAVDALHADISNRAAQSVVEYAGFQCPRATHPYLEYLFTIADRAELDHQDACFHETSLQDVAFLYAYAAGEHPALQRRAFLAFLETRLPEAFDYVRHYGHTYLTYLHEVGFEATATGYRQLYPTDVLHVAFPASYIAQIPQYPSLIDWARMHPTWTPLAPQTSQYRFGGAAAISCGVCGRLAHHLMTFDPVPDNQGVTGVSPLVLVTCLSCLGWERELLSYAHESNGEPTDLNHIEGFSEPQFPVGPLRESEVGLVDYGPRWRWQDWGATNSRENLHRVGGHPSWIQGSQYPTCPRCGQTENFLMQLDSNLLTSDGGEWLWGSGGLCYIFWCDQCKVSSCLWQCT